MTNNTILFSRRKMCTLKITKTLKYLHILETKENVHLAILLSEISDLSLGYFLISLQKVLSGWTDTFLVPVSLSFLPTKHIYKTPFKETILKGTSIKDIVNGKNSFF